VRASQVRGTCAGCLCLFMELWTYLYSDSRRKKTPLAVTRHLSVYALPPLYGTCVKYFYSYFFCFSQISGFSPQSCQPKRNAQGVCRQVDNLNFGPFYFDLKPFEKPVSSSLFVIQHRFFKPSSLEWKFWGQFSTDFSAVKHPKS